MEITLLEKVSRIINEIFLLTEDVPVKYDSEYDILRIGIEYLLKSADKPGKNITTLKDMFVQELIANALTELLGSMAFSENGDYGASFIRAVLAICRKRKEYKEALYRCILRTERLELAGKDNEFTQQLDGLLARNLVRNEAYMPLPRKGMPT